ncbi:hypothetical protein TSUD_50880 [Trifolium subterraneum]|uniref:Inner centromere protein ARK-binding domain-containing protein n=1 Tax=Trifolium subterraneum TaxID=3900 RepID=A0A2Z6LJT3_TRISU|nr:hypothetical protein TSUD_50880 [Trifolium subterraneum]
MEEKGGSQHLQVNSGQDIVEHLTCVERSTSSRIIYPRGDTESSGLRDLDLIGTGEALPELEGFLMQTDNTQSCTARDNSVEYTSHGRSRFMHSPVCYSSTPYKLHSLENLYQSLPNGLLEGFGLQTGSPLNDGSPRALSDCGPKCNDQFRSSVQTLWDRFNSNFGSSGKRRSSKPELPCISEENENVDEIAGTFHKGIGSEGMTGSIMRRPLAVIVNNANPSTSVLEDTLASGREDFVSSEFNLNGTHNKVKKKLDKQDGDRTRFTSKGKDNHSISLGANGAKRNSKSVRKGSSRPRLSKDSRRDIKVVKALKAAAAAKDAAEKKENERKKKKEEQLERMKKKKEEERKKEAEMPAKKRLRENEEKKKEEERKKDSEMPAKKRQRENEEKKENQRKTKHVNEMKQQEKKKEDLKVHQRATDEEVCENRTIMDGRDNHNILQENRQGNAEKNSKPEPLTVRDSPNNKTKESCRESVSECANKGKASMVDLIKDVEDNNLIIKNSLQEQSYEMSPYRSDDDEDEDDIPNHKFIPSWASKHSLSLIVSSQKVDPQTIFPRQSFCDIAKDNLKTRKDTVPTLSCYFNCAGHEKRHG